MSKTPSQEDEQPLLLSRLSTGDRPSLYALGIVGTKALQQTGMAVFMVDALGRVVAMPPTSVTVLRRPRISNAELDRMRESEALELLVKQGDSDEQILEYLQVRKEMP